jgi:tetratricopeptide (TPR) repeat protein
VRARLAWKSGALDVASERYRRVAAAARRLRSDELRVRAWIGESIVARLRGNYPASRSHGGKAAGLAEQAGFRRLASVAHQSLMVSICVAGDYEAAIGHGWQAFLYAAGNDPMECAALGNLGQVLLEAGHPETATSAFRAVLRRQPLPRIVLPALSGLALAAARCGRDSTVEQVRGELLVRMQAGATPYDTATVMLDLARAYATIGDTQQARGYRQHALELALAHGFHEIQHHADSVLSDTVRTPASEHALPPSLEEVAGTLRILAGA